MFSTMIDNECNILNNMSKAEFREFRSLMIEMVLHTGNTFHFFIFFFLMDFYRHVHALLTAQVHEGADTDSRQWGKVIFIFSSSYNQTIKTIMAHKKRH